MDSEFLFITELAYQQLKARARILIFSNEEFKSKELTIVSENHEQILKHWLTKLSDFIFQQLRYISQQTIFGFILLETQHRINSLLGDNGGRMFRNTTHSISTIYVSIWDSIDHKYWSVFGIDGNPYAGVFWNKCGINSLFGVSGSKVCLETQTQNIHQFMSVFGILSIPNTGQYLGLLDSRILE